MYRLLIAKLVFILYFIFSIYKNNGLKKYIYDL